MCSEQGTSSSNTTKKNYKCFGENCLGQTFTWLNKAWSIEKKIPVAVIFCMIPRSAMQVNWKLCDLRFCEGIFLVYFERILTKKDNLFFTFLPKCQNEQKISLHENWTYIVSEMIFFLHKQGLSQNNLTPKSALITTNLICNKTA